MQLQSLTIRKIPRYLENEGQYEAKLQWADVSGQELHVILDPGVSRAVLEFVAPLLSKFAAEAAKEIETAIGAALLDGDKDTLALPKS